MNKKIIVALDLDNINKSIKIVKELKKEVYAFKIGHEFFYNFGINGYKKIYNICPRIFLDLKLHDIPNTVQKGLRAISKLKPIFTTIHISGGDEMQKISALHNSQKTKILGVTVLTSLDEKQTLKYYKEKNVSILVKKFANYAKKNNLSGLVCSPLEINIVRKKVGKKMILVVPGIRPNQKISSKNDDQKRTLTPKEAIDLGANFLVIGRPIIESKNPLAAIKKLTSQYQYNSMIFKICGLKKKESLLCCEENNADFFGMIFYKKSPRNITFNEAEILISTSKKLRIKPVGVFVDHEINDLKKIIEHLCLKHIQLHGDESQLYIDDIKNQFDVKIIKKISINNSEDLKKINKYKNIDYLLFDYKPNNNELPGGNAKSFDWNLLKEQHIKLPWFISGGINETNIKKIQNLLNPNGIDLSSGVEVSKGIKSNSKINNLFKKFYDN